MNLRGRCAGLLASRGYPIEEWSDGSLAVPIRGHPEAGRISMTFLAQWILLEAELHDLTAEYDADPMEADLQGSSSPRLSRVAVVDDHLSVRADYPLLDFVDEGFLGMIGDIEGHVLTYLRSPLPSGPVPDSAVAPRPAMDEAALRTRLTELSLDWSPRAKGGVVVTSDNGAELTAEVRDGRLLMRHAFGTPAIRKEADVLLHLLELNGDLTVFRVTLDGERKPHLDAVWQMGALTSQFVAYLFLEMFATIDYLRQDILALTDP